MVSRQREHFIHRLGTTTAIQAYRIVRAVPGCKVAQATGEYAPLIGISLETATPANGMCDFVIGGFTLVQAGAPIDASTAIVPVRSDTQGRAFPADVGDLIVGYALESAAADELVSVFVSPSKHL
jgi:hypothetical protein